MVHSTGASRSGRRLALPGREVVRMVAWSEIFTYSIVLISFASLILQICKKK